MRTKKEGSRLGALLRKGTTPAVAVLRTEIGISDHLVQSGNYLALTPLHSLAFSQFGGKIVFGLDIVCSEAEVFKSAARFVT